LGTLFASSGKYKESEEALQKARKILEGSLGPRNMHLADVFEALSKVYEKLEQKPEAKAYATKAQLIRKPAQAQQPQNN
jgi:hypothetical protein